MFVDAVWPNLMLFALGQGAGFYYLRTGRLPMGYAATIVLWLLLDWWLVARYLFAAGPAEQRLPLILLQIAVVAVAGRLLQEKLRQQRGRPQRTARFRAAMVELLAGRWDAARDAFRRLIRVDAWDAAAWLACGDAELRRGDVRAARRCWLRASALDLRHHHRDLLAWRLRTSKETAPRVAGSPTSDGADRSVPAGNGRGGAKPSAGARTPARTG